MATEVARPSRKSNMMERLRRLQLRGPSTTKPAQLGRVVVTTQHATDNSTKHAKGPTSSKGQARHHEGALDLDILNSKLQQYAQTCSQDDGDDDVEVDGDDHDHDPKVEEEGSGKEPCRTPGMVVKKSQESEVEGPTTEKEEAGKEGADSAFEHVSGGTSRQTSDTRASSTPSIVVHPPGDEQETGTERSDFDLFLQQAEDEERTREEKGLPTLSKSKPDPPVNPFYSTNLPNPSSVPPKLAEIQESGDQESLVESAPEDLLSSQHTASSASSGSNDFAATATQEPTRANTASLGRHVSFCEPQKLRARSDSHGSAYHARGFESPKALKAVTKRKSFRKKVRDCIRHF